MKEGSSPLSESPPPPSTGNCQNQVGLLRRGRRGPGEEEAHHRKAFPREGRERGKKEERRRRLLHTSLFNPPSRPWLLLLLFSSAVNCVTIRGGPGRHLGEEEADLEAADSLSAFHHFDFGVGGMGLAGGGGGGRGGDGVGEGFGAIGGYFNLDESREKREEEEEEGALMQADSPFSAEDFQNSRKR